MTALGYSVGEDTQRQSHGLAAAIAKLHQPGKTQGIPVTRPCAVELAVVELNFFQHQMNQVRLPGIKFLHDT